MEIDDLRAPYDAYYVSNGRLVAEMVTGRQQIGIKPDRFAERAPAQVTLGDRDDPTGPTLGAPPGRSVRGGAARQRHDPRGNPGDRAGFAGMYGSISRKSKGA